MCGRFTIHTSAVEIARAFDVKILTPLTPRFNVAPSQEIPVVRLNADTKLIDKKI